MRLIFSVSILVCLYAVSFSAVAAKVVISALDPKTTTPAGGTIEISGEIDKSTPMQVEDAIKATGVNTGPWDLRLVLFNSAGGDVQSALNVGRLLRKANMMTTVGEHSLCASACVLAFLGGVNRMVLGKVGLHRAFPSLPSSTTEEVRANREKIDRQIREYLASMKIPERLLFEMNAVSPGSIRWLYGESDEQELRSLQIAGEDPTYADGRDAFSARKLSISMQEYYARRQRADVLCMTNWPIEKYTKCFANVLNGKQ